jgi:hypothetical protein
LSWFKKSKPEKPAEPTLSEALTALEQCGVRKRDNVSMEDLLFSTGGTANDPIDYVGLLCLIGGDVERDDFRPISDDIWHFDTSVFMTMEITFKSPIVSSCFPRAR